MVKTRADTYRGATSPDDDGAVTAGRVVIPLAADPVDISALASTVRAALGEH